MGREELIDLDPWVLEILVCPRDKQRIRIDGTTLVCPSGHQYAVVDGTPIMLLREAKQTHWAAAEALERRTGTAEEYARVAVSKPKNGIDPFVQTEIVATNGNMYRTLTRKLKEYPIPDLPDHLGPGKRFLEVGCNWGRWCIAASRLGYSPIGIDPSLEAIRAARRVGRQLCVSGNYLVADARYLPFADSAIDNVFSFSVLQHFDRADARESLEEMRRVLAPGGSVIVQMANAWGLRCLYHQARRGFRKPEKFEVRYWTIRELKLTFERLIGAAGVSVQGFFGLNIQHGDIGLLPARYGAVVWLSEALRRVSQRLAWMTYVADSVYLKAEKR